MLLLIIFVSHCMCRSTKCPFTSQNEPGNCFFCRYCPYRELSCCQPQHEIGIHMSVEVHGDEYWNCRLMILQFSECGKCSPDSNLYIEEKELTITDHYVNFTSGYVQETEMNHYVNNNYGIRVCRKQCEYIYNYCKEGETISGESIIPDVDENEFCRNSPFENNLEGIMCYSHSVQTGLVFSLLLFVAAVLVN